MLVRAAMALAMGPLLGEFGWRGFALDPLQTLWNTLVSSLVLGVFWWAWHFPLFFMVGMLQYEWGLGSLAFWAYTVGVFALSILFTWVFNSTARSILAALLLHFMYNFTVNAISPMSVRVHILGAALLLPAVMVVVLAWGANTLSPGVDGRRVARRVTPQRHRFC